MSNLDYLFNAHPNIFGFRINEENETGNIVKIIDFWASNDWDLDHFKPNESYGIIPKQVDNENARTYCIAYTKNQSFDLLLVHLTNFITRSLDKAKKEALLSKRIAELSNIFDMDYTLDELTNIELKPVRKEGIRNDDHNGTDDTTVVDGNHADEHVIGTDVSIEVPSSTTKLKKGK